MFELYKSVAEMEQVGVDAGDVAKAIGGSYANTAKLETTVYSTTLQPFKEGGGEQAKKAGDLFGRFFKPKITITDALGHEQLKYAPYGEPKETAGTAKTVLLAVGLAGAGALFAAGRLSKRIG